MIDLQVVDAFTDEPFTGNPAAVTVLDRFPPDEWMARVALEMNLSETAFAVPRPDGDHDLRWFTPAAEVDLCGHATLATAHVLGGRARFHTRSGLLTCVREADGRIGMDFPADPPEAAPVELSLPGATLQWVGRGRFDVLVEVADTAWLRAYSPDLSALAAVDARCVILTAAGDEPGLDFVSRVFCPRVGIPEDPVTGSAHCTLASYWAARTGRSELEAYQASPRGGRLSVRLAGERVTITGRAVTVSKVRMLVDPPPLP